MSASEKNFGELLSEIYNAYFWLKLVICNFRGFMQTYKTLNSITFRNYNFIFTTAKEINKPNIRIFDTWNMRSATAQHLFSVC